MTLLENFLDEIERASRKYGPFTSTHEGLGVLLEEICELQEAIHKNDHKGVEKESIQVAAVAYRLAKGCGQEAFYHRSGFEEGGKT